MEPTKPVKPLPMFGLDKLKKVSWSENLTDVKVMTPQPSVFDNIAGIVFSEEEEVEEEDPEIMIKIKKPITFSESGLRPNVTGNHEKSNNVQIISAINISLLNMA